MTGSFKLISGVYIFKRCMKNNKVRNIGRRKLPYSIILLVICSVYSVDDVNTIRKPCMSCFYILYLEVHDGFRLNL
jgi:hypothetical protein